MPSTRIYGLPYEHPSADQPGITLHGGTGGGQPILAEAVEAEIARVEREIARVERRIADLESPAVHKVTQGTEQDFTSTTSLAETAIVVPIQGLTRVWLAARWASGGGGARWDWDVSAGSVTMLNRSILSPGESTSTTSGTHNVAEVRFRQIATTGEDQTVEHFNPASTFLIWEELIVEGDGELTFRMAQETTNPSPTSLHESSYAIYQRLAE